MEENRPELIRSSEKVLAQLERLLKLAHKRHEAMVRGELLTDEDSLPNGTVHVGRLIGSPDDRRSDIGIVFMIGPNVKQ